MLQDEDHTDGQERPIRDAEPIAVRLVWWPDDVHPATQAVIELLTNLYRSTDGS